MSTMRILTAAAFATVFAVSTASAQQRPARRRHHRKVEGNTLYIKSASGPVTLTLADNALIVARVKASAADIKAGDYVASGGVPQPDGTQKAVELRIFPDEHARQWRWTSAGVAGRPQRHHDQWRGRPDRHQRGRPRPHREISGRREEDHRRAERAGSRLEVADKSELKSGVAVAAAAATKQPDGTFTAARIDFGRGDVVP